MEKIGNLYAVNVKILIEERELKAIEELLPSWQQYESKEDGTHPFEKWTAENLLQHLLDSRSKNYISECIKSQQLVQGKITIDEFLNRKPFRLKEEREEGALQEC